MGSATKRPPRTKFSPPELARRWGVDPQKIILWIKSGELGACNMAARTGGRPRYMIDVCDIVEFEQRRRVTPPEPPAPRRRRVAVNSLLQGPDYV